MAADMKKDITEVLVTILGTQELLNEENSDEEPLEIIGRAQYFCENGIHHLTYSEVQEGFAEATINEIRWVAQEQPWLEMSKKGLTNTFMKYQEGAYHETQYQTPFGEISMGFDTHSIIGGENEEGIFVSASYRLDMEEQPYAECLVHIQVQEIE